jgi:hypothetical protein
LTFHARREITVTYVREARRRTVEARIVSLGRYALAPQTLGPAPESYSDVRIVAAPGGRTVVAWANVHGTEMGARSRYVVRAALREPNASRFRRSQLLDPGIVNVAAPGELGAQIADDGTATVAWSSYTSTKAFTAPVEVRAATAAPGRRFAAPQVLTANGHLDDLVVGGAGAALAVWTSYDGGGATIGAALRPSSAAAFGVAEAVTVIPLRTIAPLVPAPDAAYDPGTGRFAVLWAIDSTSVTDPPMQIPGTARLLLATRDTR